MKRTNFTLAAVFVLSMFVFAQAFAGGSKEKVWRFADGTEIPDTSMFVPPQPRTTSSSKFRLVGKGETEVAVEVVVGLGGQTAAAAVRGGSSPEEIEAAIEAAEQALFTPATLNGVPVAVRYELRYRTTSE